MDGSQIAVLVAIIVVVVIAARAVSRRSKPDSPADRGPYSSSTETTAGLAAFGVTNHRADGGSSGGDWGGGGGGGGGRGRGRRGRRLTRHGRSCACGAEVESLRDDNRPHIRVAGVRPAVTDRA